MQQDQDFTNMKHCDVKLNILPAIMVCKMQLTKLYITLTKFLTCYEDLIKNYTKSAFGSPF